MPDDRATCDGCEEERTSALTRTIRLTVDGAEVDAQVLCPACFADWIDRYQHEMTPSSALAGSSEIIVD